MWRTMRVLTVQLLDGDGVVVWKSEVRLVSLMPRIHQRPRDTGVSQPEGMTYLVRGHQEQIYAWK